MNYKLVESSTTSGLERQVSCLIVEGWVCQGGIALANGWYMQAMVRE